MCPQPQHWLLKAEHGPWPGLCILVSVDVDIDIQPERITPHTLLIPIFVLSSRSKYPWCFQCA